MINLQAYKDSKEIYEFGNNEALFRTADDYLVQLNNLVSNKYSVDFKERIEVQQKYFVFDV